MSTPSTRGMLERDNTVIVIYAHGNGDIEYTGILLDTFYNTEEKSKKFTDMKEQYARKDLEYAIDILTTEGTPVVNLCSFRHYFYKYYITSDYSLESHFNDRFLHPENLKQKMPFWYGIE